MNWCYYSFIKLVLFHCLDYSLQMRLASLVVSVSAYCAERHVLNPRDVFLLTKICCFSTVNNDLKHITSFPVDIVMIQR